jgi:hypothetical protein
MAQPFSNQTDDMERTIQALHKPMGYNKLASLMGPHAEVAVFRRFASMNMFNLLFMQAELLELERKFTVAYLDDQASDIGSVKDFCRDFVTLRASEGTQYDDQLKSIRTIQEKLEKYSTVLKRIDTHGSTR